MSRTLRPIAPRAALAGLVALSAAVPARALFRFNEGRDQVYVTAYIGAGWDSNVFTRSGGDGDLILSGGAGIEYARRAGLIGVNASLGWDFGSFSTYSAEDFLNPRASLEFTKGTGRTTGSLSFHSTRDSRADPTVGLRTDSWNYGAGLNLRYPVIERYSIAGNFAWDRADYQDDVSFSDLDTYTMGTDVFYNWRSDRDLLFGYRYRTSNGQFESSSFDHSFYGGVSGRIVSKLSGNARIGWSTRTVEYPGNIPDDTNDGLYVSVSATWPATKRATFTLSLSQDFSTTSSNFETRTTSADLIGQFSHTVKFSSNAQLGAGHTEFLSGYSPTLGVPVQGFNGQTRNDYYVTAGCGINYVINSHLTFGANYTYYRNWSDLSAFAFDRHSFGVTLSSRW